MKRISAVICELNPLHDGHRYVFSRAKESSDVLIAVMSGNFVQRGESAVYHKYKRAEAALSAGADIVLELPFPYSASSAEFFAAAGVKIAEGVGATALFFGSECGDITSLKKAGEVLSSEEYRKEMTVGRSAELRGEILRRLAPGLPESLLSSPNDILGAEYCRRATVETFAVKRISCESASAIREKSIGTEGCDMLDPARLAEIEFTYFRTRRNPPENIAECAGGVGERLFNTAFSTTSSESWSEKIRTKQYTNSRLRRAALFALCSVTPEMLREECGYTTLLGADKKGREYLSSVRKTAALPIITNPSEKKHLSESAILQYETGEFADSIYALLSGNCDSAFFVRHPPVILE